MCAFTRTPLRDPFYVGGTGFKPRSHARGIDRVLSARAKLVHSEEPRCGSRTRQRKHCKIFKGRYRNCVTIVRESLRTKRLKKSAGIVGLHADRLIVPVINGQRRRDEAGEGGGRGGEQGKEAAINFIVFAIRVRMRTYACRFRARARVSRLRRARPRIHTYQHRGVIPSPSPPRRIILIKRNARSREELIDPRRATPISR